MTKNELSKIVFEVKKNNNENRKKELFLPIMRRNFANFAKFLCVLCVKKLCVQIKIKISY